MVLASIPCLALCFPRQRYEFKVDTRVAVQSLTAGRVRKTLS